MVREKRAPEHHRGVGKRRFMEKLRGHLLGAGGRAYDRGTRATEAPEPRSAEARARGLPKKLDLPLKSPRHSHVVRINAGDEFSFRRLQAPVERIDQPKIRL